MMHMNKAVWTLPGERVVDWADFFVWKKSPWFLVEPERGGGKYHKKNAERNRKHTYVCVLICVVYLNIM